MQRLGELLAVEIVLKYYGGRRCATIQKFGTPNLPLPKNNIDGLQPGIYLKLFVDVGAVVADGLCAEGQFVGHFLAEQAAGEELQYLCFALCKFGVFCYGLLELINLIN